MKIESILSSNCWNFRLGLPKTAMGLFALLLVLFFVSCSKDAPKIKINSVTEELPSLAAEDFEMLASDSSVIRFKMQTPEFIRHKNEKEPYTEFPKGVKIEKYDANMNIVSGIGFESNQDFSEYHIKNLKGNMYVNVDE